MKKLKLILPILAIGVLFVGCGKKDKDVFIETTQSLSNRSEYNQQEVKLKIDDLKFDFDEDVKTNRQGLNALNMVASQLKGMDMTGITTINPKNNLIKMDMNIQVLGSKMNLLAFLNEKDFYLSTSYLMDL